MAGHPGGGGSQGYKRHVNDATAKAKQSEPSNISPNTLEYAIGQFNLNRRIVIKDIPPITYDEVKQFLGDVVVNNITISKKARQAVVTLRQGEQAEDLVDLHNGETLLGTAVTVALQPNDRLLCVAHLPFNMDDSDFRSMLEPFGALERCFLMRSDRDRNKGYGLVEFQHNRDQSGEVRTQLDGRKVGSCVLHCDFLSPTLTTFADLHSRCLLLDHLPPNYRGVDRLREVFSKLQVPTYFQLVMKGGEPLGFGVAEYSDYRTAEATQLELNHYKLDNYNIRVTYCSPGQRAGDVYARLVSGMSRSGMLKRGTSLLPSPTDRGPGGPLLGNGPGGPLLGNGPGGPLLGNGPGGPLLGNGPGGPLLGNGPGGPLLGNGPGASLLRNGPGPMGHGNMGPPGGRPNMGPNGPNMGPNGPNMGHNGPNMGPNGPSGPNMGPNGPNMGPSGPNMGPNGPNMGPNGPNMGPGMEQLTNPQMAALLQQSPQLLQTFQKLLGQLQQNNSGMMGPPGPGGGQQNQLVDPNLQVALLAVMMAMQLQQAQPNLATSPLLAQMTANMPQQPGQGKPSLLGNPLIAQANSMLQNLFQNPHQGPSQPAPFSSPNMPALSPSALNNFPQLLAMFAQGMQGGPQGGPPQDNKPDRQGLLGQAPSSHRQGLLGNGPRPSFMGPPDGGNQGNTPMGPANPLLALFLETQIRQCMSGGGGPPMGGPPGNMNRPPGPQGGMRGPPGPGGPQGGPRGPRGNAPLLGDGPGQGFNQNRPPLLGAGPGGPARPNRPLLGPRPGAPGMGSGPPGPLSPEVDESDHSGMGQNQGFGGPPPRGPLLGARPGMNNSGPLLGQRPPGQLQGMGPGPSGPGSRPPLLGAGPGSQRPLLGDAPVSQSSEPPRGPPPMASLGMMSEPPQQEGQSRHMPPHMEGRTLAKPGGRRGPLLGSAPGGMEGGRYDRPPMPPSSEYNHQGNNHFGNPVSQSGGLLGDQPSSAGQRPALLPQPGSQSGYPGNRSGLLGKRPGSDDGPAHPGRPLLGKNWAGAQQGGGLLGNAPNGRWQTWGAYKPPSSDPSQGAYSNPNYQQSMGADMGSAYGSDEPSNDDNSGVYRTNMSSGGFHSGAYQTNITSHNTKPQPPPLPKPEPPVSPPDSDDSEQATNAKIYASMMQFYNALCEGNNAPHNMLAQYFGQITAQLAATASSKSNPGGQSQSQAPTSQYAGFSGEKNYNFSQAETSGTYVFGSDRQNTQTSTSTQRQPPNPFSEVASYTTSGSMASNNSQDNSYFNNTDFSIGSPDQPVFMTSSYKSKDITSPGGSSYDSQMWTPPSNKRPRLLPSPEPSPEGPYVGQHSQGIGGHYAETHIKKHRF